MKRLFARWGTYDEFENLSDDRRLSIAVRMCASDQFSASDDTVQRSVKLRTLNTRHRHFIRESKHLYTPVNVKL